VAGEGLCTPHHVGVTHKFKGYWDIIIHLFNQIKALNCIIAITTTFYLNQYGMVRVSLKWNPVLIVGKFHLRRLNYLIPFFATNHGPVLNGKKKGKSISLVQHHVVGI
jgi:hypothetical protein